MPLPPIRVRDEKNQFERDVKSFADNLSGNPLLAGHIVEADINGPTRIFHGLGRQARGWFVTYAEADVRVYLDGEHNDKFIELNSNTPASVELWIF